MTNGHSHLHAYSHHLVVVEVLEDAQPKGRQGHSSSVNVHHDETPVVVRVVILKELDYFPQKKWLDDFNYLLYDKE